MKLPNHIREKLGFNLIHDLLIRNCVSDLGEGLAKELEFSSNYEYIGVLLQQVHDFRQILVEGNVPELAGISNISELIAKSRVEGNWLAADQLYKVLINITVASTVADYMQTAIEDYPSLKEWGSGFYGLASIVKRLEKSIDEEGNILDSASPELKSIRRQIQSEAGTLRKKINAIYNQAKKDGHIPDGATVSVREGRMVIPVLASNKRKIQGFVHDESATGNIVFLEPAQALESNNRIRELELAETREIHKILLDLTSEVGSYHEEISETNTYLAKLDFLIAKAKVAIRLDANLPELKHDSLNWKGLYHPHLVISAKEKAREVISHEVRLDSSNRILLISGPNAGGKSVALKSIGLNQLMLQAGLLPCCDPDSSVSLFNSIFVDIGDEQSIDNDLSTYSSHLRNMVLMLKKANDKSLILIDEFGSGTDPAFGGVIAESILAELVKNEVKGVITTHFSNLKLYADKTAGVLNGAMLFDLKELKPLYVLEVGRPGSSFSLEVATKSGIPKSIIDKAKEGLGSDQIDVENLLNKLEDEKSKYEYQNKKIAEKDHQLNQLKNEYKILKKKLEDRQKDIINLAKEEASNILAKTNKEIEKTIRHIKENKAEKKETKRIRENLSTYAGKLKPERRSSKSENHSFESGPLIKGDKALIIGQDVIAEVLEVKGKKAKVLIGELQSVISLDGLKKVSNREAKKIKLSLSASTNISQKMNDRLSHFSPILDVRGTRAAELLPDLQKFLDAAVMFDQSNVKVIHGKGNGVLRQLVREELKQWSQIERYENEHVERGGDGATIVYFK